MSKFKEIETTDAGDKVVRQIGVLNETPEQLNEECPAEKVEPEEVGRWITVIGRALSAIFKI